MVRCSSLRCEDRVTPLAIDEPQPRLSWRVDPARGGATPVAFRVVVDGTWDSGRIADSSALAAVYAGPPLAPRTRYGWSVTVEDDTGATETSRSWFETGQQTTDAWSAAWIGLDPDAVPVVDPPEEGVVAIPAYGLEPCPRLRRTFSLAARPVAARVYASARGLYALHVNGAKVGDAELAPGWTDYRHRVQYQAYDVTDLLQAGENVLAAEIADGWFSGFVGFDARQAGGHYGRAPQLIAELHVEHADGTREVIATDGAWRTTRGPRVYADLLMGECLDARAEQPGWDRPGFGDAAWTPATVLDTDTSLLVAQPDEPVRALHELPARTVVRLDRHTHLVDLGQNFAGRVRITVRGAQRGATITLRHAETLDEDGRLYTANLRTAAATDVLIASGADTETFEPRFTFHGFRYVEVHGLAELEPGDVTGIVLHSDTPRAGVLRTSDEELNRLQHAIAWGQRSNFLSVPTDCPQRDERLGWTADAQVFLPTACLNADVAAFFTKWLADVRDAQRPDGAFSNVAPRLAGVADEPAPGWGDAGVLIPWHLYRTYGDDRVLARALPSMCAWVDYLERHNPDLVWRHRVGPHFGDWLAEPYARVPREVLATAYFAHSAELTARSAEALGKRDIAHHYATLAARIRTTFTDTFVDADGRVQGETQTGYLLALAYDLLPPELRTKAAAHLAAEVEQRGHLTTGFMGVALLTPVLDAIGRDDLAHRLLARVAPPSWRHQLRHGATTIWERWDGYTPERGFQAPAMNSLNHYALGSVGEWLYRGLAGIDQAPDSVAYRRIVIRPRPGDLAWAEATYESVRGRIAVRWERSDGELRLDVEIPPGATAAVHVPGHDGPPHEVGSGRHSFTADDPARTAGATRGTGAATTRRG